MLRLNYSTVHAPFTEARDKNSVIMLFKVSRVDPRTFWSQLMSLVEVLISRMCHLLLTTIWASQLKVRVSDFTMLKFFSSIIDTQ